MRTNYSLLMLLCLAVGIFLTSHPTSKPILESWYERGKEYAGQAIGEIDTDEMVEAVLEHLLAREKMR